MPIAHLEVGHGEPVVFVHSGGGRGSDWARLFEWMPDGLRCVAVDMFGYGATPGWPSDRPQVTIDDQARLLLDVVDDLGGRAHVVGHSFGGAVTLRGVLLAAESYETMTLIEPQALPVLEETGDPLCDELVRFRERFDALHSESGPTAAMRLFLDHYSGDGFFDRLPDTTQQDLASLTEVVVASWSALLTNEIPLAKLRQVTTPTAVIRGTTSPAVEQRMCEILLDNLPNSHEEVISEAGHMSPMTHPKQVAAALTRHILTRSTPR